MGLPAPGDVLVGRYAIEHELGKGGMGVVYVARHLLLEQHVAVKMLLPQAARTPGASTRFLREARVAAAIRSQHVARVLDVGELECGLPYLVMEHLTGNDLEEELRRRGPLPLEEAVDYVLQACQAIVEAHALGIVHRDLKPGNLFLAESTGGVRVIKVLDFGISKLTAEEEPGGVDAKLTSTDMTLGSPIYMSPEQVRSAKDVDARTDIWSLGVILYQLLTDRFPFEGASLSALFASIAADAPTPPRQHRPDLPIGVEILILHCLEKDRAQRVPSVVDLAQALEPYGTPQARVWVQRIVRLAAGEKVSSPALQSSLGSLAVTVAADLSNDGEGAKVTGATPAPSRATATATATASVGQMTLRGRRVGWAPALAIGGFALLAVGLALALWLRPGALDEGGRGHSEENTSDPSGSTRALLAPEGTGAPALAAPPEDPGAAPAPEATGASGAGIVEAPAPPSIPGRPAGPRTTGRRPPVPPAPPAPPPPSPSQEKRPRLREHR